MKKQNSAELFKNYIIHILTVYPGISPTMLQVGMGPTAKAGWWKPILEEMIEDKIVAREWTTPLHGPAGKKICYKKLSLIEK